MPYVRDPFVHEVSGSLRAVPNNLLITVKGAQPVRPPGVLQAVMYIEVVSLMDETNDAVLADIGFMVGSHITWSRTFGLTTAGHWYRNHVHYTLRYDHQVVARFRIGVQGGDGAVDDVVHMNVNGYYLEPYKLP